MTVHLLTKHSESFDAFALILGRAGFFSRGFIWASVGIIAVVAAFTGDKTQGTQGALEVIASRNGGVVFLILITLGIFCYSSWRFFEGIYGLRIKPDASNFQKVVNGIITPFASGIAYLIFAAANINDIVHGIDDPNGSGGTNVTAKIASRTIGKVFLTIISFFLFVTAIMWVVDLIRRKILLDLQMKRIKQYRILHIFVITFAYLGTFGRAILFALLGTLFLRLTYADDIEGGGFGVALQQLQYNTTARIFLVFFGFLIFNFGIFSCFQAIFKNFFPYKPHLIKKHREPTDSKTNWTIGGASKEVRYEKELDAQDRQEELAKARLQMHGEQLVDHENKKDEEKKQKTKDAPNA